MNVLLLRGNPRKNGYTQRITDLFVEGVADTAADLRDIDLQQRTIRPCIGCFKCWTTNPGTCIFRDDMDELLPMVMEADVIVVSSPLYFYTVSAAMKIFLERLLPVMKQGFEETPRGLMRNRLRYPDRWGTKRVILIAAGAFKKTDEFSAIRRTYELAAEGLGALCGGILIRPESYLLQFSLAKPKSVKTVETALKRAGYEAGTRGAISEETQSTVAAPLSESQDTFMTYANIYWEHVMELGADASDLGEVQRRVTTDARILMREMARSIDPVATARLKAILQFDFSDKDYHFRLEITKGSCVLTEETAEHPDLRVTTTAEIWGKAFTRESHMRDLLLSRKILLEGDKSLFMRLDRYFPPPAS